MSVRGLHQRVAVTLGAVLLAALPAPLAAAEPDYPSEQAVRESEQRVANAAERIGQIEARLATATAELDAAAIRAAQAAEAYNGALAELDAARAEAADARRRAEVAAAAERAARAEAGRFAAAQYQLGGDAGLASLLLGAASTTELADRVVLLDQIEASQRAAINDARAASIIADLMRTKAAEAEAAASAAADAVLEAKQEADAAFAAQEQAVADIEAERTRLTAELAELRRTSVALEQARQAGLEQERREREAARAQREAEERRRAEEAAAAAAAPAAAAPAAAPDDAHAAPPPRGGAAAAVAYAKAQLGKPYEWGADGPDTFDCSGLTMMAWRSGGVSLPHYSVLQYERSTPVRLADIVPGDLIFYATDRTRHTSIYHVGLYIGDGEMIHAPYTGAYVTTASIWRSNLFGAARP